MIGLIVSNCSCMDSESYPTRTNKPFKNPLGRPPGGKKKVKAETGLSFALEKVDVLEVNTSNYHYNIFGPLARCSLTKPHMSLLKQYNYQPRRVMLSTTLHHTMISVPRILEKHTDIYVTDGVFSPIT